MLELQKFVLLRVSDNKNLFKRELTKSLAWLSSQEVEELREWAEKQFGKTHADVINEVFCAEKV